MRSIGAVFVALTFFALVAAMFGVAWMIAPVTLYLLIAASVVAIGCVAMGGRAIFGTHEHPERVVGRQFQLLEADGLGANPPSLPPVTICGCQDGRYEAAFTRPFEYRGQTSQIVRLVARHVGHPVSRAKRSRVLAVNAELESGDRFIALILPV